MPRKRLGDEFRLVVAALAQPGRMQWHRHDYVGGESFAVAFCHPGELPGKPAAQRRDLRILEKQDGVSHGRRIGSETAHEIEVIGARAAKAALRRRAPLRYGS